MEEIYKRQPTRSVSDFMSVQFLYLETCMFFMLTLILGG